jgi:hypothetical protein
MGGFKLIPLAGGWTTLGIITTHARWGRKMMGLTSTYSLSPPIKPTFTHPSMIIMALRERGKDQSVLTMITMGAQHERCSFGLHGLVC